MRLHVIVGFLLAAAACTRPSPPSAPPVPPPAAAAAPVEKAATPRDPLEPVYEKGLEGDMKSGLEILRRIPVAELGARQRKQRDCMEARFSDGIIDASPGDPPSTLAAVLDAYHAYWSMVLMKKLDVAAGEAFLRERLQRIVAKGTQGAHTPETLDAVLDTIGAQLEAQGLHSIRGVTAPYYDLIAWRTQVPRTYDVTLPDGPAKVNVVLLDQFESRGWSAFATCDRSSTGGWAEKDTLYCVADTYDLSSEHFAVSYLVHETQHFSDYRRFPKLEGPELEYRAKLAEIIESKQTTRELIQVFVSQAGNDDSRTSPHALANRIVARDLARAVGASDPSASAWQGVDESRIRAAAADLFRANTALLIAQGAQTVSKIF